MLLAVTPLPRPLTTPPVTSTYFISPEISGQSAAAAARIFLHTEPGCRACSWAYVVLMSVSARERAEERED
jgi:hypothetical protein